jgi:hypothetical protein
MIFMPPNGRDIKRENLNMMINSEKVQQIRLDIVSAALNWTKLFQ